MRWSQFNFASILYVPTLQPLDSTGKSSATYGNLKAKMFDIESVKIVFTQLGNSVDKKQFTKL